MAVVALGGSDDRVERSLGVGGLQQLRVGAAAADHAEVADEQNVARIGAPGQDIALDVPAIERRAHGGENFARIKPHRRLRPIRICGGHGVLRSLVVHRRLVVLPCPEGRLDRTPKFAKNGQRNRLPPARVENQAGLRLNYRDRLKNSESFASRRAICAEVAELGPYVASQGRDVPFRNRKGKCGHRPRPDRFWCHLTGWVRPPNPAAGGLLAQLIATAAKAPQTRPLAVPSRPRLSPSMAQSIGARPRSLLRSAVRCEVHACEASISTCRCELRIETMKPASTSTSAIMVSRKKVEVPACRTSRNSISMTMNSPIARM